MENLCEMQLDIFIRIILEDLTQRGYRNSNKNEMFNVEHCQVALKCLAKLHAAGIVYQIKENVNLFEKHANILEDKIFKDENNGIKKWLDVSVEGMYNLIDCLNLDVEEKKKFKNRLLKISELLPNMLRYNSKETNTILHSDLWLNNFLFLYDMDKPTNTVLVDYQLLKYGDPAVDVVAMLLNNTRKELRSQHYTSLLNFYYNYLLEVLEKYQCTTNLKRADFLKNCFRVQPILKVITTADKCTTFLSDECLPSDLDMGTDEGYRKFIFQDRAKYIVQSFLHNEKFRELIEEDLLELQDQLKEIKEILR